MGVWRALLTVRNLVRLVITLALGAWQIYFDPFDIADRTRETSYLVANRLVGPFVELGAFRKAVVDQKGDEDRKNEANRNSDEDEVVASDLFPEERLRIRDDIVLVVLRDEDVKRYGEIWQKPAAWPLPFGAHAEVIGRIRLGDPRAVYVDFVFDDKREDQSLDSLLWAVDEYDAEYWKSDDEQGSAPGPGERTEPELQDIPIYFAGRRHRGSHEVTILRELGDKDVKIVAARRKRGSGYDLWDPPDEVQGEEELQATEHNKEHHKRQTLAVSPALAIYIDQCRRELAAIRAKNNPARENEKQTECPAFLEEFSASWLSSPDKNVYDRLTHFNDDMQILWGSTPSPRNFNEFRCKYESIRGNDADDRSILELTNYAISIAAPVMRLLWGMDCYYNPVATVGSLFKSNPDEVNLFLKDKIVIYTADVGGISREIVPPTSSTDLPFAVKHAMALENLIYWGKDYLRVERDASYIPFILNNNNISMFVFGTLTIIVIMWSSALNYYWPIGVSVGRSNVLIHLSRDVALWVICIFLILFFNASQIVIFRVNNLDFIEFLPPALWAFVIQRNKYAQFAEGLTWGRTDRLADPSEQHRPAWKAYLPAQRLIFRNGRPIINFRYRGLYIGECRLHEIIAFRGHRGRDRGGVAGIAARTRPD